MTASPAAALTDPDRLAALRRTGLLDAPADPAFDRLAEVAAGLLGTPMALVTLVDADGLRLLGQAGLPAPWPSRRDAPLSLSWCRHIVTAGAPLLTADARRDPALCDAPAIAELGAVACAGVPLTLPDGSGGRTVGALSVFDRTPRAWPPETLDRLAALGVLAVAVVERQRGERVAAEAAEELRTVLHALGEVVLVLDRDGRYLDVAPGAAAQLYRPAEQLLGRTLHEIFPVAEADGFLALVRRALAANDTIETDYTLTIGGRALWFHTTVTPLAADRVIWVARDITARRRAEAALRSSEERLRLVARATQDVIYDYDVAAGTIGWNEAATIVFRTPAEALGGIAWWDEHIHPDDFPRVAETLGGALAGGAEGWSQEYRFRRGDGTYATVLDRGYILRDAAGYALRMIGSMTDLTERTRLEEQLRQAQKMEAVGQLAGGVAHDFNNLLAAVAVNCALLRSTLPPGVPGTEEVEEIRRATDRAAVLTRQLLAFSRKQVLQPRVLDLNEVVRESSLLLERLPGDGITVELALGARPGRVLADPNQLTQVLLNLAVNARDAMPGGGTLTVSTTDVHVAEATASRPGLPAGDHVVLAVRDTGIGMDEATRVRIFEPFFTTKPMGRGTGLGLSTVYGIVEQSGGRIYVDSAPGLGTTMSIYLPRHAGRITPSGGVSTLPAPGGTETVLLVEDEQAVRQAVRRVLERHGYTVLEAQNGVDALRRFEARLGEVGVVLSDMVMPEMGGRELVEQLRRRRPGLRVLFVSGYDQEAVGSRGALPENTTFLQKPFTVDELLRRLRDVLDRA